MNTTFQITNTVQENDTTVIVFAGFTTDDQYTEESFRFPLSTSLSTIFKTLQDRATFFDERKIEIQNQFDTLSEQLIPTQDDSNIG